MPEPFWDGERIVNPEVEFADPIQLQCPKCGHIASIDFFDCAGIDVELPEYGIGPDDNDVWCPNCREEIPAVVFDPMPKQTQLFQ